MSFLLPTFLGLVLLLIQPLKASTFEINKDHSRLKFIITYMNFSEVEGSFSDYTGSFSFDEKNQQLHRIQLKIKTSSVSTLDKKRDGHLRRQDFFYSARFPEMSFHSDKIRVLSENNYAIQGKLTIKNVTKNIFLKVSYLGEKEDHAHKQSIFFKGSTILNRQDFGLTWNKTLDHGELLLGQEVKIEFNIQAQPIGFKTAYSTHFAPDPKSMPAWKSAPTPPEVAQKTPSKIKTKSFPVQTINPDGKYPWYKWLLGFLGFCAVIVLAYWLKMKMIQFFKWKNYAEASWFSFAGDGIIVILTMIYSVWFYALLF